MDLALLTGMDRGDMISLTRAQCLEDGIRLYAREDDPKAAEENHRRVVR